MKAIFLSLTLILTLNVSAADSLDILLNTAKRDSAHSPFERGEVRVKRHPLYSDLVTLARNLHTKIIWASSVPEAVLAFPYHEHRMEVDLKMELEGWFDEFTSPNTIVLDRQTNLSTLIHEVRHAVQLGSHGQVTGNWFDKTIQLNKRKLAEFHYRLESSNLRKDEKVRLRKAATTLIEFCSEISAHSDEIKLALAHDHQDNAENYQELVNEYKAGYKKALNYLLKNKFSDNYSFIKEMDKALSRYLNEN